jgi:hypothetical protein
MNATMNDRVKALEHRAFLYERCGLFDLAEALYQQAAQLEMAEWERSPDCLGEDNPLTRHA